MKGKITYKGKELAFENLAKLSILVEGKPWVYEHCTEKQLRFKPAPVGGVVGIGNYLKQWRKRRKATQTEAAKIFGVSQSLISRIEKGGEDGRSLPEKVFERIRRDNLKYGTATPWGE